MAARKPPPVGVMLEANPPSTLQELIDLIGKVTDASPATEPEKIDIEWRVGERLHTVGFSWLV